jgi:hypothetical protein
MLALPLISNHILDLSGRRFAKPQSSTTALPRAQAFLMQRLRINCEYSLNTRALVGSIDLA